VVDLVSRFVEERYSAPSSDYTGLDALPGGVLGRSDPRHDVRADVHPVAPFTT
jgi:hypothetical protein